MISPQTIALVRERTDVVALIQESVPTLKRRGRSFVGLCPFHKEKSPSFHVNPERGFFHCFGCKESGSAIDFLMKLEGMTFPEAVRFLGERAGVEIEEQKNADRTEADRQKKYKDDLYAANNLAAAFYEKMLREHPQRRYALAELERRGLRPSWDTAGATERATGSREGAGDASDEAEKAEKRITAIDDTLQAFRIGYAPAGWDGLAGFFKQQGISPIVAEQAGLLVPRSSGSGHFDRFRHRLMFAVVDPQGRVIAFSGRALDPIPGDPTTEERDGKTAKYINSPESPVYTKGFALFGLYQARHTIRSSEQAIVVEGNFDVVSLHARGINNVVAPLGTAFTVDQAKLLKRFASSCILLFDGDAAGRKAVRLSRGPLKEAGIAAKVATLPEGVDPDDLVRSKGASALEDVVSRASGMLEFLIEDALDQRFAEADAREKLARVNAVVKLLAEEDDPLVRSLAKTHADAFAARIDMKVADWRARRVGEEPFRALEQAIKQALREEERNRVVLRPGESREHPKTVKIAPKAPGSIQRTEMVSALLEYPELLRDPEVKDCLNLLEGLSARTVASLAAATRDGTTALDVPVFFAELPPSIQAFAAKRLAAPSFDSPEAAKAVVLDNAHRLRDQGVAQDTRELTQETARAAGDWDAEVRLATAADQRVKAARAPDTTRARGVVAPHATGPSRLDDYGVPPAPQVPHEETQRGESLEAFDDGTSHAEDDAPPGFFDGMEGGEA